MANLCWSITNARLCDIVIYIYTQQRYIDVWFVIMCDLICLRYGGKKENDIMFSFIIIIHIK